MQKRLAIIGSNDIAAAYRDALADFPEIVLDGVMESNPPPRRAATDWRPSLPGGAQELLGSGVAPHLALVCTPPASHWREVRPLLRAGVDVLIESPLAFERTEAEAITALAESLGRVAMTAGKFRVFEAVLEARRLIEQGRIGRLVYLETALSSKLDSARSWSGSPELCGDGVWMGYGPDCLDLVEMLAGPPERIRVRGAERQRGARVEDEVRVETEHPGGLISRSLLSWSREIPAPIARCVGETGEILIGWAQSLIRTEREEEIFATAFDEREVCRALLAGFLRQCRSSELAEDHGGQSLAWVEAGYRSLHSQRWEIA